MTCPHCGADASAGQKFCPKCSRLVDSPLLKVKQQIDAAREEIRRDLNAARTVRFSPPPSAADARAAAAAAISRQGRDARLSAASATEQIRAASLADARADPAAAGGPARDDPAFAGTKSEEAAEEAARRGHHARAAHGHDASLRSGRGGEEGRGGGEGRRGGGARARALQAAGVVHRARAARPDRRGGDGLHRDAAHHAVSRAAAADHRVLSHPLGRRRVPVPDHRVRHVEAASVRPLLPAPAPVARVLWVPIGTIYAVGTWLYLGSKTTRLYFSGRSPRSLNATELAAWRTSREGRAGLRVPDLRVRVHPRLAYAMFVSGTLPMVFQTRRRRSRRRSVS